MSDSSLCEPNIIPVRYTRPGEYGDFSAMIRDPKYKYSLFIFNDNVEDHETARPGGGNAAIRPYNRYGRHSKHPRSAGIPTGFTPGTGGFSRLTPKIKKIIDSAVDEIKELQELHDYEDIYFSADASVGSERPQLGTAIFRIGDDVRRYITDKIYSLGIPTF